MKQIVGAFSVSLVLAPGASAQTPAGGEFRVNAYTTGSPSVARPATEADGNFVVAWTSYAQDGSSHGVFG